MKRLAAIIVVVSLIVVAVIALAIVTFAPVMAAARPQGRMQDCTARWLATGNPDRAAYAPFLRACLAAQPMAAVPVAAVSLKSAPGMPRTKKPNRMKLCGARWQVLKASGSTGGQTWRQFSTQCLRTH